MAKIALRQKGTDRLFPFNAELARRKDMERVGLNESMEVIQEPEPEPEPEIDEFVAPELPAAAAVLPAHMAAELKPEPEPEPEPKPAPRKPAAKKPAPRKPAAKPAVEQEESGAMDDLEKTLRELENMDSGGN